MGRNIRQNDKGLICLTDLHKAAGGKNHEKPSLWAKTDGAMSFMVEVRKQVGKATLLTATPGRNGGTFAHWQIALAYAKYLSPELHMAVNETYMRYNK